MLAFPPLLLLLLVAGGAVRAILDARQVVTTHVVSALAAAVRQNLPLPAALEAACHGAPRRAARALYEVSVYLVQGLPLSEALRQGCRRMSGHAVGLIAAAETAGQVPAALAKLESDLARTREEQMRGRAVEPFYFAGVLVFMSIIMTGLGVFVLPQFENILADMGTTLPASTRFVLSHMGEMARGSLVLLVALGFWVYTAFRTRRPGRLAWHMVLGDLIRWHLPVWGRLERERSRMRVVQWLHLALEGGQTMQAALDGCLYLDLNLCYRVRVQKWRKLVSEGEDASRAARRAGVGRSIAWALDGEIHRGNAARALGMLDSICRASYGYRYRLVQLATIPVGVAALTMAVGFVVYAMIAPLTLMIRGVMMLP